jgi:hypothetical protein
VTTNYTTVVPSPSTGLGSLHHHPRHAIDVASGDVDTRLAMKCNPTVGLLPPAHDIAVKGPASVTTAVLESFVGRTLFRHVPAGQAAREP